MEFQRESTPENGPLKRWKSLGVLNVSRDSSESPSNKFSESSIEICYIYDSDSSVDDSKPSLEDSGIYDKTCHQDVLMSLEHKIDKLSEIIQEQSNQLAVLQQRAQESVSTAVQRHAQIVADTIATVLTQKLELPLTAIDTTEAGESAVSVVHAGAKALLDALESKKLATVDQYIKTALTEFLQSKDLRDLLVSATTSSIQALIKQHFAGDVTASYLPLLDRAQKRLLRQTTAHLDEAFKEIEAHATNFSKTTYKTARFIRQTLERHQRLVETTTAKTESAARDLQESVSRIIEQELKQWRKEVLNVIQEKEPALTSTPVSPRLPRMISVSPPQPIEPGRSVIDQLMSAAEINNKLKDGDVNGSFERALSASDLALVMAACRAADPAWVFAQPCQLKQHVLLSLVQQLATDMVHDTQLKCRYLEDSIMNLDTEDAVISKHLKTVIEGVCGHLSIFLKNYPSHMSSRRIQMLIMAAGSLVNKEHVFSHPICTSYVS